ncbi:MAG: hypothetical protein R3272_13295 [Candidatus Promineifilaceae bacterium]|nr:hypothetical protein [Candidatus Promineifilaceae bacterium]
MRRKAVLTTLLALSVLLVTGSLVLAQDDAEPQAPEVFAHEIYGGCYLAELDQCRIHVEPFTINVDAANNERLAEFRLSANNESGGTSLLLYHFSTDASYSRMPVGDYTPSFVQNQDYGAVCGETYNLRVTARGATPSSDGSLLVSAISGPFTCPQPATPTAVMQSLLPFGASANMIWPLVLLFLLLAPLSVWVARRQRS